MKVIISDASPLHYLALIAETQILPALFGNVIVPQTVFDEIQQPRTPESVRVFAASSPAWLEVRRVSSLIPSTLSHLDRGEQEAIILAIELQADTLLMDEMDGREAAESCGLRTMGTLRVLYDAALRDLCDLEEAFNKLRRTNFRATEKLYQHFITLYDDNRPAS